MIYYSDDELTWKPARDYQIEAFEDATNYYNDGTHSMHYVYVKNNCVFKLKPKGDQVFIMQKEHGKIGYLMSLDV